MGCSSRSGRQSARLGCGRGTTGSSRWTPTQCSSRTSSSKRCEACPSPPRVPTWRIAPSLSTATLATSRNAFGTLLMQMEDCYAGLNWKVGIKNGKYGPMGEDLFAQKCMDRHGVKKVERFDLTRDGACPADRPKAERKNKKYIPSCVGATTATIHPFKKPEGYFKCMELADQLSPAPRHDHR